jgi:putative transposase
MTVQDFLSLEPVHGELLSWAKNQVFVRVLIPCRMRDVVILFLHLIVTVVRLAWPGGLRSVVAESLLVKHQLLILNRGHKRAPNLHAAERIIAGLCTLIDVVVELKRRNPTWGCPRIAQQITLAFGVEIDKDVVRRILSVHYRPESDSGGPSWLTFLGHIKDSLWSCDLFRCESATLRTHWVLVVMDQFTRRIVGFGVQGDILDGAPCAGCSSERFEGKQCRSI